MKTILQIVTEYLQTNGYDGLYNTDGECACLLGHLAPCESFYEDCVAGYRVPCDGSCVDGNCEFHIVGEKKCAGKK